MADSERIRLNRVDLKRNIIKSRVSKIRTQNTYNQNNSSQVHFSTVPVGITNTHYNEPGPITTTYVQPASYVQPANYNTVSTYQSSFVPASNPTKNAYSFSFQKPVISNWTKTWLIEQTKSKIKKKIDSLYDLI